MPDRMTVAGPVRERLGDLPDRAAVGLGEVAGQQLDRAGQHEADQHGADGEHPRVAAVVQDRGSVR